MGEESRLNFLSPFRVLDLTDEKGYFCAKILGDLGAQVTRVEPKNAVRISSGGHTTRKKNCPPGHRERAGAAYLSH